MGFQPITGLLWLTTEVSDKNVMGKSPQQGKVNC